MEHVHRLSVALAALLVTGLVTVAFATRMSAAAQTSAATGAQLAAPESDNGTKLLQAGAYRLRLAVTPNRAPSAARVRVAITRAGKPLRAARVRLTITMLEMRMAGLTRRLHETGSGRWDSGASNLALGMAGRWGLRLDVVPQHGPPFSVAVIDRVGS